MKPAPFELLRPASLDEAIDLLARHAGAAKPIAGGQSLVPMMNLRVATPEVLVDLNRIEALRSIRIVDGHLRIGAMTRQSTLLEDPTVADAVPLLARALAHVGHVQTRSRGTIGGSLVHGDPSAELPLVAVTLDARLTLLGAKGRREVPARSFFRSALDTDVAPDELLVEVALPLPPRGAACAFRELARRRGDFAIVAVAAQRTAAGLTVGAGGIEAVPRHCAGLATLAPGASRTDIERAIESELATLNDPLADVHASAAYRRQLARVLLLEAIEEVLAR